MADGEFVECDETALDAPVSCVKLYVMEVALALDAMHSSGLVCWDLKLENVLIDSDGHVLILDPRRISRQQQRRSSWYQM